MLVTLWAVREVALGRFQVYPNPLYVPAVLFAGLVAIQILFHLTAYWYVTWSKAWLWTAYAGIFFLASQIFNGTIWLQAFGLFCAGYGFLMSLFAIIQQFTWNGKIYWIVPNRHGGWVYGPYVNHAHYAGLMEMLIPFSLIFAITDNLLRPLRGVVSVRCHCYEQHNFPLAVCRWRDRSCGRASGFDALLILEQAFLQRACTSRSNLFWTCCLASLAPASWSIRETGTTSEPNFRRWGNRTYRHRKGQHQDGGSAPLPWVGAGIVLNGVSFISKFFHEFLGE